MVIKIIISYIISLTIHKLIHYIFAKIFNRNPKLKFILIFPYIEYLNKNTKKSILQNSIISISPLIFHVIVVIFDRGILKYINTIFLLMILPITSDGKLFWKNILIYFSLKK